MKRGLTTPNPKKGASNSPQHQKGDKDPPTTKMSITGPQAQKGGKSNPKPEKGFNKPP